MKTEITVPSLGESVTEATIAKWYKQAGEAVQTDELLVELETEKVTLEVNAQSNGVLTEIQINEGDTVEVGQVIAMLDSEAQATVTSSAPSPAPSSPTPATATTHASPSTGPMSGMMSPSAQKLAAENNIAQGAVSGSGRGGRVTKNDMLNAIQQGVTATAAAMEPSGVKSETRVRMTRLRKTIAQRLKDSQNTAAILTTFNEIDMSSVIAMRKKYQEEFIKKHGIKLGFMSFFVKATVEALKAVPAVNAEIDGDDLVYKNYYDLGVAVGTEQGLVVPVVRSCDSLSVAGIEQTIKELGTKAREGKLSMKDLSGGTFTISNGGVYGSLLSTPIINPPQSGILGIHNTQMRPVAIDNQVEIRPMMYIALSYDHRIIDGKEAVTFLIKVKEAIENPERLLFEL